MPAEPPDTCAHCGADIHPNARACPECGADESTGWEEDYAPDLGLDEDEFDYDETMAVKAFAPDNKEPCARLREVFSGVEDFTPEPLEAALKAMAEE